MAHANHDHAAPAILAEVKPASLPRATLVENNRSFNWVTEKICGIIEGKTPTWWWVLFTICGFLATFTIGNLIYLVVTGVGVWGLANPVNWGWAIVNFVFWIGIGHAGTLISAILCLLCQKWRTSINRAAEAMTIFAVVCAGIFPVFHVGRVWFAVLPGYLFPVPNANAIWPYSVKLSSDGKLAIADTQYYRVLIWNQWQQAIIKSADVIIGQPDAESNGQNQYHLTPKANTLNWCYDSCFVGKKLVVADSGNSRILIWDEVPTMNNVHANYLIGQPHFSINGESSLSLLSTLENEIYWPFGLCANESKLAVADTGNHRVIIYQL